LNFSFEYLNIFSKEISQYSFQICFDLFLFAKRVIQDYSRNLSKGCVALFLRLVKKLAASAVFSNNMFLFYVARVFPICFLLSVQELNWLLSSWCDPKVGHILLCI